MQVSLYQHLEHLVKTWTKGPRPTASQFMHAAEKLLRWKKENSIPGLWTRPPLMLFATLDDGLGHGLTIIENFASLAGAQVERLGLMLDPETILEACRTKKPGLLGLTVLRNDMDEHLIELGRNLPKSTMLVAGGPAFSADPDLASLAGVDFVAKDAAAFVRFLLSFQPEYDINTLHNPG